MEEDGIVVSPARSLRTFQMRAPLSLPLQRRPEFKVGIPAMSIVFLTAAVTTAMTAARLLLPSVRPSVNVSPLLVGYGRRGILVVKTQALVLS